MAKSIGISHHDWPEGDSKELVEEFEAEKAKFGFQVAAHKVYERTYSRYGAEVSFKKEVLEKEYFEALEEFNNVEVAKKILANPMEGKKLASEILLRSGDKNDLVSWDAQAIKNTIEENERRHNEGKSTIVIPGWEYLSRGIGGFNPGRVGLLTAPTGFGKSTLAINLLLSARKTMNTVCFNMEMLEHDFAERMLIAETQISYGDWKGCKFDIQQLKPVLQNDHKGSLRFTRGNALSIEDIYSKLVIEKKKHGLDFVVIDYDQKINLRMPRGTPEWKALQIAIQELEEIAKQLEVFILVMSQANENGDPSGSKRSKYSASCVLSFYRRDDSRVFIKAIKNRFGKHGVCIECNYDPGKSFVKEQRVFDREPEEEKKRAF